MLQSNDLKTGKLFTYVKKWIMVFWMRTVFWFDLTVLQIHLDMKRYAIEEWAVRVLGILFGIEGTFEKHQVIRFQFLFSLFPKNNILLFFWQTSLFPDTRHKDLSMRCNRRYKSHIRSKPVVQLNLHFQSTMKYKHL